MDFTLLHISTVKGLFSLFVFVVLLLLQLLMYTRINSLFKDSLYLLKQPFLYIHEN